MLILNASSAFAPNSIAAMQHSMVTLKLNIETSLDKTKGLEAPILLTLSILITAIRFEKC